MVIATAGFSILLVALSSQLLRRVSPATFVPIAFAVSAVLLLADWGLTWVAPAFAAQAVYLQISGLGPMLGSGFWLIATERFDPYTARHNFGRLAAVGTLSGLGGALVAERVLLRGRAMDACGNAAACEAVAPLAEPEPPACATSEPGFTGRASPEAAIAPAAPNKSKARVRLGS